MRTNAGKVGRSSWRQLPDTWLKDTFRLVRILVKLFGTPGVFTFFYVFMLQEEGWLGREQWVVGGELCCITKYSFMRSCNLPFVATCHMGEDGARSSVYKPHTMEWLDTQWSTMQQPANILQTAIWYVSFTGYLHNDTNIRTSSFSNFFICEPTGW